MYYCIYLNSSIISIIFCHVDSMASQTNYEVDYRKKFVSESQHMSSPMVPAAPIPEAKKY